MFLAELESIYNMVQKLCSRNPRKNWDTYDATGIKKFHKTQNNNSINFLTKIWKTLKSLHVINERFIEYLRQLSA
jgi:hypothetical protein